MAGFGGSAADHISDVGLGQFVVGQIDIVESVFTEQLSEGMAFPGVPDRDANENVGPLPAGQAVIEFGDISIPENVGAEPA
jgi:hypothetical protein